MAFGFSFVFLLIFPTGGFKALLHKKNNNNNKKQKHFPSSSDWAEFLSPCRFAVDVQLKPHMKQYIAVHCSTSQYHKPNAA